MYQLTLSYLIFVCFRLTKRGSSETNRLTITGICSNIHLDNTLNSSGFEKNQVFPDTRIIPVKQLDICSFHSNHSNSIYIKCNIICLHEENTTNATAGGMGVRESTRFHKLHARNILAQFKTRNAHIKYFGEKQCDYESGMALYAEAVARTRARISYFKP